jgi:hypothetical protein
MYNFFVKNDFGDLHLVDVQFSNFNFYILANVLLGYVWVRSLGKRVGYTYCQVNLHLAKQ